MQYYRRKQKRTQSCTIHLLPLTTECTLGSSSSTQVSEERVYLAARHTIFLTPLTVLMEEENYSLCKNLLHHSLGTVTFCTDCTLQDTPVCHKKFQQTCNSVCLIILSLTALQYCIAPAVMYKSDKGCASLLFKVKSS